jgi:hypothetical protein
MLKTGNLRPGNLKKNTSKIRHHFSDIDNNNTPVKKYNRQNKTIYITYIPAFK